MRLSVALLLFSCSLFSQSRNVILVTADGLRWQEVFRGIDPMLMYETADRRDRYWKNEPSTEARRALLMQFFWKQLAPHGAVFGNLDKGSSVKVTNKFRVSYPGYAEILTGRAQDDTITGNIAIQNPSQTVLEFLVHKLHLDRSQVALFSSWDHFHWIGESKPGTITINAGYQGWEDAHASARAKDLSHALFRAQSPWDEARHDYFTFELALEYLKTVKPRVMHIALDETDDWAHERRYDRVLDSIAMFDRCLEELFAAIDAMPEYKGSTTVIVTADHGRGSTINDWSDHGRNVPGADQIWLVIAGPGTPAIGEAHNVPEIHQRDIAPTILSLMGISPSEMPGLLGTPVRVTPNRTAATPTAPAR